MGAHVRDAAHADAASHPSATPQVSPRPSCATPTTHALPSPKRTAMTVHSRAIHAQSTPTNLASPGLAIAVSTVHPMHSATPTRHAYPTPAVRKATSHAPSWPSLADFAAPNRPCRTAMTHLAYPGATPMLDQRPTLAKLAGPHLTDLPTPRPDTFTPARTDRTVPADCGPSPAMPTTHGLSTLTRR